MSTLLEHIAVLVKRRDHIRPDLNNGNDFLLWDDTEFKTNALLLCATHLEELIALSTPAALPAQAMGEKVCQRCQGSGTGELTAEQKNALKEEGWRAAIEVHSRHGMAGWSSHKDATLSAPQEASKPEKCSTCGGRGWVMTGYAECAGADECPDCIGGSHE